jgi:ABC-type oligopeptide transport system ATPase subunit
MPLVDVRQLTTRFGGAAPLFGRSSAFTAVADVSFSIERGEVFGLVGESGSGKTTVARSMLRLVQPESGEVLFAGEDVLRVSRARLRELRRQMQMVFQDPHGSLDPRMWIREIVREPLDIHGLGDPPSRLARVERLLEQVGLDASLAGRYPHELSGGQRQRVGIARALALDPSFLIADEPVSALDLSVQAQVINLLLDLQAQLTLTCLLIAHDLRLVAHVCHRVAVMRLGRIVEMGPASAVFSSPQHPYTKALLSAVPAADPERVRERIRFEPSTARPDMPLRAVGDGHWAAV